MSERCLRAVRAINLELRTAFCICIEVRVRVGPLPLSFLGAPRAFPSFLREGGHPLLCVSLWQKINRPGRRQGRKTINGWTSSASSVSTPPLVVPLTDSGPTLSFSLVPPWPSPLRQKKSKIEQTLYDSSSPHTPSLLLSLIRLIAPVWTPAAVRPSGHGMATPDIIGQVNVLISTFAMEF